MDATGRAGPRERQLSRAANCSGSVVARGVCRVAGKPFVWIDLLVESACPHRARGRLRANAGFAMAERAMDGCLHLQGCPKRYDRSAWLGLSALVHYSFAEGGHCAARFERKIFRRAFLAACARAWKLTSQ